MLVWRFELKVDGRLAELGRFVLNLLRSPQTGLNTTKKTINYDLCLFLTKKVL